MINIKIGLEICNVMRKCSTLARPRKISQFATVFITVVLIKKIFTVFFRTYLERTVLEQIETVVLGLNSMKFF